MDIKPGNQTTEWATMKWVMWICGLVGMICASVAGVLTASGTVEPTHLSVVILGGAATVLGVITGQTGKEYIKGRSNIKANEVLAKVAATKDPPQG